MNKKIEEIAEIIDKEFDLCTAKRCKDCEKKEIKYPLCIWWNCAKTLYNAGYRKVNDNEVEKLKKELAEFEDKQFRCDSCDRIALTETEHKLCIKQARKETAREILQWVYDLYPDLHTSKIIKFAEKYGVEVE